MSSDIFDQTVCTPEERAKSGSSGFYCYTRRQNVGLVVVALAGFASLAAIITIFGLILRNFIHARKKSDRPRLIQFPMDLFVLSLFFGDLFQSLGVVIDVRWINNGVVRTGSLCNAQGVLQNMGQAAIAMTTFIITLHTFDSLWRHRGVRSLKLASILVGTVWIFLILMISISASIKHNPPFYAPTPYWCWINSSYPNYRIALENFWLWIGFAVSILYIPLLFWDAGHITPGDPRWWNFKLNRGDAQGSKQGSRLVICALAYCLPVLPTSLARWFLVVHGDVKPFATAEAQFVVKAIFSLSGVCDVIAFRFARSGLLLFPPTTPEEVSSSPREGSQTSINAGGSDVSLHNISQRNEENGERDGEDDNIATKNRLRRPSKSQLLLGVIWVSVNVLDAVWITYYIRSAVDPNPRSAVNKSHAGWQAYYLIMYVFGFFWGCVNIVAWMWYFQRKNISGSTGRSLIRSRVLRYSWRLGHILVLFPVAVIMCLGPFFAPTIGINLSRENAWLHRCDSYMVEVVLGGLAFSSPQDATPIAAFYFRQPDGRLEKQQEYHLINDRDDIWHLTPAGQTPSSLPTVTYYLGNSTLSATCTTPNATICTVGSFQESGFLTFSIVDAFNKSTVTLRAVDKEWVYGKADDAPSYILREVQDKGDLGAVVVRTAVTNLHDCTSLKLCANSANVQTLVPVGLTLLKQNEYSKVCTTPNSN